VVSRRDPSLANWLDTTGHSEGTIVFRNYRSKSAQVPHCRLVKFTELQQYLPKDTALVTPADRAASLEHRRAALLQLHGE
jgi:hypothetical protein